MKKVTKGLLLKFKYIHIVLPIKFLHINKQLKVNMARKFLSYVINNKEELLYLMNINTSQLNEFVFENLILDKMTTVVMYDMKFIIDDNSVTLNYRHRANRRLQVEVYNYQNLRIVNV